MENFTKISSWHLIETNYGLDWSEVAEVEEL